MSGSEGVATWLQRQWYGAVPPHWALRALSPGFAAAVALRRKYYGARARRPILGCPVVVVGNLSVGGTGKTPLVIALVELLREHGWSPGVISRGYGGSAREPREVLCDSDPGEVGDEPLLIRQRAGCRVFVSPKRLEAARAVIEAGANIVLSDDGLQHYALPRDVEIAVVDGMRRFGNGRLLPAGPLREPVERLASVDLVVCNGGRPGPGESSMTLDGGTAVRLADGERCPLAAFAGRKTVAMAGIGNPERFFLHLAAADLSFEPVAWPDHHAYSPDDFRSVPEDTPVLITEKDAVKCRRLDDPRIWYIPVSARLDPAFAPRLLNILERIRHGQTTA
ncbi:MAG: tetraacyldisaccharide 4'-kinase [Methylococcus sp.]|nr:tetraacyldisaccharide 4'-kinase [Methylococcus sp.]